MNDRPEIVFYLARADNGVIGNAKDLPWRLPPDLKRLKQLTMGKVMIMGRKTFESFGGPLPGRRHIVLTRDKDWRAKGAEVVRDPEEALIHAGDAPEIAILGGGEIYAIYLTRADRIELTEVHLSPDGDTQAPDFPAAEWRETAREDYPAESDLPAYSFVTLVRR